MNAVFDPLRLWAVAVDVLACARGTPQTIAARQRSRLVKLIETAARDSLFYRERLPSKVSASLSLTDLPVTSKGELMARFDDWVTDSGLKLEELRLFVADSARIGEPYLGKYLIWESSGTGHLPGVFVQNARAMAVYDALEALRRSFPRPLQQWLDPMLSTERIAFVGAIGGHFASVVSMQRLRELNPWVSQNLRFFSMLTPLGSLVDDLNDFAPTVIATYPTVAAVLADCAIRSSLHFSPKEVWCGGETLSAAVRNHVEQSLQCTVRNNYGASEFLSIGWECEQGRMHANTDWLILEPVDEHGRPTPPGQSSYTTLLTNLANDVQPLIRYDLGDQISVHPERCACGVTLPVISVKGRRDDPLVMAGRHGQPVTLLPLAITTVLEEEAGVFDFQVCQRDETTLILRLNLQGEEAVGAAERCCIALQNFAVIQGLAPMLVLTEIVPQLSRGRSGKAQRVKAAPGAYSS